MHHHPLRPPTRELATPGILDRYMRIQTSEIVLSVAVAVLLIGIAYSAGYNAGRGSRLGAELTDLQQQTQVILRETRELGRGLQ